MGLMTQGRKIIRLGIKTDKGYKRVGDIKNKKSPIGRFFGIGLDFFMK